MANDSPDDQASKRLAVCGKNLPLNSGLVRNLCLIPHVHCIGYGRKANKVLALRHIRIAIPCLGWKPACFADYLNVENALTFDVEDYYQVGAFSDRIEFSDWERYPSRVEPNTLRILEILGEANQQATFFVLGWVAAKFPTLVRRIAEAGHEVACHSYSHRRVFEMTPAQFWEDTRRAKRSLEDATGHPVLGYRAPSFSIDWNSLWAFAVLAELGFTYDSSLFPVGHPSYGMRSAPRHPFRIDTPTGSIMEFPMPTLNWQGHRSPLAGGAYLRILPYWYTRWGIRYINEQERRPVCVYLHPWEMDPDQPRMSGSLSARLRHYLGLRGTETKLLRLLKDFEFCPLRSLVAQPRHDVNKSLPPNLQG